jgi:hypothetical protein
MKSYKDAYKDPEYHKHYRESHLKELKQKKREYHLSHKKQDALRDKKNWIKNKQKVVLILGDSCIVCGSKQNVEYHNIKSIKHQSNPYYILSHIKDFVPLCWKCHRAKTRLNQLTPEQITVLISI